MQRYRESLNAQDISKFDVHQKPLLKAGSKCTKALSLQRIIVEE